jgi:serine/threonine-protein kinase RsbW
VEPQIELHLPSRLGWERAAMDLAASVARRMGFPPERVEDIKTAVSEATTNAIEHGNRRDPTRKVVLTLVPAGRRLEIGVTDRSSIPFPVAQAPRHREPVERVEPPDLAAKLRPGANTRGWGLFLIKELVDEVEFTSSGEGNHVRMVLYLEPKAA